MTPPSTLASMRAAKICKTRAHAEAVASLDAALVQLEGAYAVLPVDSDEETDMREILRNVEKLRRACKARAL